MPLIATCRKCTAPFVVDAGEGDGSRAASRPLSRCEACRREALERSLEKSHEWVKATGLIAIVFLVWAGASLQQLKRHDDLEWAGHLGVSVTSALLACFFYFRRLRPQLRQHEVGEHVDLLTGETADMRRWRRLEEVGALDWQQEERVGRKRRESTLEWRVAQGLENKEELREHRRCSRLLDEIADVDRQLDHLESEGVASGTAFPADLDRLRTRRAKLCRNLERRPVWPRLIRDLMALGFMRLCLLPLTVLGWLLFKFAWQAGNLVAMGVIGVCLFGPLVLLVARTWFARPRPSLVGSAGEPAHDTAA